MPVGSPSTMRTSICAGSQTPANGCRIDIDAVTSSSLNSQRPGMNAKPRLSNE